MRASRATRSCRRSRRTPSTPSTPRPSNGTRTRAATPRNIPRGAICHGGRARRGRRRAGRASPNPARPTAGRPSPPLRNCAARTTTPRWRVKRGRAHTRTSCRHARPTARRKLPPSCAACARPARLRPAAPAFPPRHQHRDSRHRPRAVRPHLRPARAAAFLSGETSTSQPARPSCARDHRVAAAARLDGRARSRVASPRVNSGGFRHVVQGD